MHKCFRLFFEPQNGFREGGFFEGKISRPVKIALSRFVVHSIRCLKRKERHRKAERKEKATLV